MIRTYLSLLLVLFWADLLVAFAIWIYVIAPVWTARSAPSDTLMVSTRPAVSAPLHR